MSESPTPNNPVKQIGNLLGEVSGFVVAIVAYLMAVTGQSPGPLPKTTAVFTVLVTTVALWVWRWGQISREKSHPESQILVVGTASPTPKRLKFLERVKDPLRSTSVKSYTLPLTRRRAEAVGLTLLTLTTLAWTGFALPKAIPELTGVSPPVSLPLTCVGSEEPDALRVVIADFNEVGLQPPFLLEDRLFDHLSEQVEGDMAICRLQQVVALRSEALALGEQTQAAIIVWGRSDRIFEAHLEVAGWDLPGRDLPPLPSEEATDFAFQVREPLHLGFLTEFTFSEILYLDNQLERARQVLDETLARAKQQSLAEDNATDLAEAYFFLGFLFDTQISPNPNLEKAIAAYSQAVELDPTFHVAFMNRGFAYAALGETDKAMAEYTVLIESESPLAGLAYVNRALLQPTRALAKSDFEAAIQLSPLEGLVSRGHSRLWDWDDPLGAIQDFQQALRLAPEDPYLYHNLGRAQLMTSQFDAATQTYSDAIAHITPEALDTIVEELGWLAEDAPHLQEPIAAILAILQQ